MTDRDPDADATRLAHESLAGGDPTGWFERLYTEAAHGGAVVPWDRGEPHPLLVEWVEQKDLHGNGRPAVVVGCGTGENAEYLSARGFTTTAFDISPTAVGTAQDRFAGSPVDYVVADLLDPPARWRHAFDLVVEVFTVQSLPVPLHPEAIASTSRLVGPGGTLLVLAAAGERTPAPGSGPPWPLTRAEIDAFAHADLSLVRLDDPFGERHGENPRWRAEFTRPRL